MIRRSIFAVLVLALVGSLVPSALSEEVVRYRARISARDHQNSSGVALSKVEQILRQDRANFHRGIHQDPDDETDPAFADPRNREALEALAQRANIEAGLADAILRGEPLIEVVVEKDPASGAMQMTITEPAAMVSIGAPVADGVDFARRNEMTLDLLSRYRFSPAATPDSIEKGRHEDATFAPMARRISWRPDEIEVMPKKGLRFRIGAFTHDGNRVLVESTPGMLELWDLPTNSLLLTHRLVDGEIIQVVPAREEGWMLCFARDRDFNNLIIRVPVTPGRQPECLWSCSYHPELSFEYELLGIYDVIPGHQNGEFFLTCSPMARDLEWVEAATVVASFTPETGEAALLAPCGEIDDWWTEKIATPEGSRMLQPREGPSGDLIRGEPDPGIFSPLDPWVRETFPDKVAFPYLETVWQDPASGEVARLLDVSGTRMLMTRQPVDPPNYMEDYRISSTGYPGFTRENAEADLRSIGYESPLVTVQDASDDGQFILVRLAKPVPASQEIRKGYDPWYEGYGQEFEAYSLVLVNLQTLERRVLYEGRDEVFAAFSSDGTILQGSLAAGNPNASLLFRTTRGAPLATLQLPLDRFEPIQNTSALREVEPGHFEFEFVCYNQCSARARLDPQGTCDWHAGLGGGRYSIFFTATPEGIGQVESDGCAVIEQGANGAKATLESLEGLSTLRFESVDLSSRLLKGFPNHNGGGTPYWHTSDGDRHITAFSPSGRLFFSSLDDAYRDPKWSNFEVYDLARSTSRFSANTFDGERYRLGRIEGDSFAWLGEAGVAFVTEAEVAVLEVDGGTNGFRSVERVQGGNPNRAVYDSSRGWLAFSRDNAVDFYEVEPSENPKHKLSFFFDLEGNLTAINPKGQFAGHTRDGASCSLVQEGKSFPFTQFDLQLNRPDVILETLGASRSLVDAAAILRNRRLEKAGFREGDLEMVDELPRVELAGEVSLATDEPSIPLMIRAISPGSPLDRVLVYSNGVPIHGQAGLSLSDKKTTQWEGRIEVPLLEGENEIEFLVLDENGAESLAEAVTVTCGARMDSTLYVVTMGVSKYEQSEYDLDVAAKDAEDIAAYFERQPRTDSWNQVKVLCLTDGDVTRSSLEQVRDFLADAKAEDLALLFAAGHGLLDKEFRYFFATSEMDFENPGVAGGLEFEDIESVLEDCSALRKLGLIDSCHVGEMDEDDRKEVAKLFAANNVRAVGTDYAIALEKGPTVSPRDRQIISGLFAELRRGSGATIIGASGGAEFALEMEALGNGVFTHLVLQCLEGKKGDRDGDGRIDVSELRTFVERETSELTGGMQHPSTRRFNLANPFVIAD